MPMGGALPGGRLVSMSPLQSTVLSPVVAEGCMRCYNIQITWTCLAMLTRLVAVNGSTGNDVKQALPGLA